MEEHDRDNVLRAKQAQIDQLDLQLAQVQQQAEIGNNANQLMEDLLTSGVIEQNGDRSFVANGSKGKQQFFLGENNLDDK